MLASMLVSDGRILLPQGLCTAMLWLSTAPLSVLATSIPPSLSWGFDLRTTLTTTAYPLITWTLVPFLLKASTPITGHYSNSFLFCVWPCMALTSKLSGKSSAHPILTGLGLSHVGTQARTQAYTPLSQVPHLTQSQTTAGSAPGGPRCCGAGSLGMGRAQRSCGCCLLAVRAPRVPAS